MSGNQTGAVKAPTGNSPPTQGVPPKGGESGSAPKPQAWADMSDTDEKPKGANQRLRKSLDQTKGTAETKDFKTLVSIVDSLNSEFPDIRVGALKSLTTFIQQTTSVSKKDLRRFHREGVASVVGDREALKLAPGSATATDSRKGKKGAEKDPRKAELEKQIKELRVQYKDQPKGVGSEYAEKVKALRKQAKPNKTT